MSKPEHSHKPSASGVGKQRNKPFKGSSAHARLARTKGKGERQAQPTALRQLSKHDRKNQSKLLRHQKQQAQDAAKLLFTPNHHLGVEDVPHRQVLLVPLTEHAYDASILSAYLGRRVVDKQAIEVCMLPNETDYKQSLGLFVQWALGADTVVFVVSARDSDSGVDEFGAELLRTLRAVGMSSSCCLLVGADNSASHGLKAEWLKVLKGELPSVHDKVFDAGDDFFRALANMPLGGVSWRDQRPYLPVQSWQFDPASSLLMLEGVARGNASFLPTNGVHVWGVGDFAVERLVVSGTDVHYEQQGDEMSEPAAMSEDPISEDSTSEDPFSEDLEGEEEGVSSSTRRVTFAMDVDTNEDMEEEDGATKEEHRRTPRPWLVDEFEVPEGQSARTLLRDFRGVKSMRTSDWDDTHDVLPAGYDAVCRFRDYKHSRRLAHEQAADPTTTTTMGKRVQVYLRVSHQFAIPRVLFGLLRHEMRPTVLTASLRVVAPSLDCLAANPAVIVQCGMRRQRVHAPLWSSDDAGFRLQRQIKQPWRDADIMDRGATVCLSWSSMLTFDPAPVLVFDATGQRLLLVGSLPHQQHSPLRVVLERRTLSGQPFKIHKRTCVVRWMFECAEDVKYFQPVELTTRFGRRGTITESLGTHGYMKCTFDSHRGASHPGGSASASLHPHDTVLMHLYRRVFVPLQSCEYL